MPADATRSERAALSQEEVEGLLESSGALRRGHFILSSGLHSPVYVQCALLLEEPRRAERVGRALARRLAALRPDSVLSPAMGGLIIGHEVARALGVPFRFTERHEGEMALRRSFRLAAGERVVIVEDVVTTGRSTREAAELVTAAGAQVVAVGAIIDRSGGAEPFDSPFFSLVRLDAPVYDPASGAPPPADWGEPEKPGSRPSGR
jgi:orotate phosphoribosyltransferase